MQISSKKIKKWMYSFLFMFVLEGILFLILAYVEGEKGVSLGWNFSENNDAYYTILSLAFIVSSLTSILSERHMPVYWSDVEYEMLIRPRHTNIVSLIAYICATVAMASIINVSKPEYIIWCLTLTIIFLMMLTSKTLLAGFSREKIKNELRVEFLSEKSETIKEQIIEATKKDIDSNEIILALENIKLLNDAKCDETIHILKYASEANPFLFYKLTCEVDIESTELIYESLERYIFEGKEYSSMILLLDVFINKKIQSYIDTYIDGISSVEISGNDSVEVWQFDKVRNFLSIYIKKCNEEIANDMTSLTELIVCALIRNEYVILTRLLESSVKIKAKILESAKHKLKAKYSDSLSLRNLLGYFESKIDNVDVFSMTEENKNEIKYHIVRAIEERRISNNQLAKVVKMLNLQDDEILCEAAKGTMY